MEQQDTGRIAPPRLAIEQVHPVHFDRMMLGFMNVQQWPFSVFGLQRAKKPDKSVNPATFCNHVTEY
ncbi:hypothetical protein NKJ09_30675 [Mesorhizobium sp. M0189]|uniref:hypothetical protein n=1 Tax=Mesorhizobium sp. M0189 TaxID=2956909 RepID=UPI003337D31B